MLLRSDINDAGDHYNDLSSAARKAGHVDCQVPPPPTQARWRKRRDNATADAGSLFASGLSCHGFLCGRECSPQQLPLNLNLIS